MRRLEHPIFDSIREYFGQPAKLLRLFEQRQDIHVALKPTSTLIDVESVVAWHELGSILRLNKGVTWSSIFRHQDRFFCCHFLFINNRR
jgi:hypothetical protein